MQNINRRSWLKSSAIAALGAGIPFVESPLIFDKKEDTVGAIRLNSNENPHGPSSKVLEAITQSMTKGNLYPWGDKEILRKRISKMESMPADHIYIGAGSTEILQLAAMAYGLQGGSVVSCYPTFPVLMQKAHQFEANWIKVDLRDHHYDLQQLADQVNERTSMLYVCNPNNPTGTHISTDELQDFCLHMARKTMVFVDEAYIEFSDKGLSGSLAPLVRDHPNLIVARTFSKIYSIAGLRVGYAYAHPQTLKTMRKHRIGHGMNVPITSIHAGVAALDDQDFVKYCKMQNDQAKELVYAAFEGWNVDYVPSHTSFVYFK
ncbi:MAG: histidinol-phosphate aminotransferase family protein, partial [Saprospiraceae bacterium]|nr:histidinol-phosphate aminotransferase family protein [Saprospiraceae bacterium]